MLVPVRRFPILALALLVGALVLSSCGGADDGTFGEPAVATVNGVDISEDLLVAQLNAAASVEQYGPQLLGTTAAVSGEGPNTFSTAASADVLTTLIAFELIAQELDARDLEIDEGARAQAEQTMMQVLGADPTTGMSDPEAGREVFDRLDPEARDSMVDGLAGAAVLSRAIGADEGIGEVTDEQVRAAYDEDPSAYAAEESCVRHILVMPVDLDSGLEATPEQSDAARAEAEAILDELEGGADFESLASERSDDTNSAAEGGDLGCNPREAFIPEFDEAVWSLEVGETSEVVESSAGFHVLQVYDRRTPSFEDVREQIRAELEGQAQAELQGAAQQAFAQIILDAKVTVDPRFGTWEYFTFTDLGEEQVTDRADARSARVVPPAGPTTTTSPAPDPSLELVPSPEGG